MDFSAVDLGTLPEWVSAVSTFLAVIAASIAAKYAFDQVKTLQDEAAERRQAERKHQASQVSAWLTMDSRNDFQAFSFNASSQPVYNTVVTFEAPNNDNGFPLGVMQPMQQPILARPVTAFINRERQTIKSIDLSWNYPNQHGPIKTRRTMPDGTKKLVEYEWEAGPIGVGIVFTDTNGVRWERTIDGRLEERPLHYMALASGLLSN